MKSAKNFRKISRRNKNTRKINLKIKNKKIGGLSPEKNLKTESQKKREELTQKINKIQKELEESKLHLEELKSKRDEEIKKINEEYELKNSEIINKMKLIQDQEQHDDERTPLINKPNTKSRKKSQSFYSSVFGFFDKEK